MTDEPVVVDPPVVADPPVADVVNFNNDGTFGDTWQSTLEETLREDKSLSTFKNVNDLAKSFVNTKSMVGKNTMVVPTETSSEAEWDSYHAAGGRPDTVADYNLKAPDDFPAEVLEQVLPKARLEAWQERFFKAGVSKKAAEKFIADYAQDILLDIKNADNDAQTNLDEMVAGLSQDWGNAYDQKIHLGNLAIEEGTGGNDEFKARIVKLVEHNPDLTRLLANLGGKFAEGKSPNFSAVPTPADYKDQIKEIEENPLYLGGTTEQRMRLANKVMALREKMIANKS